MQADTSVLNPFRSVENDMGLVTCSIPKIRFTSSSVVCISVVVQWPAGTGQAQSELEATGSPQVGYWLADPAVRFGRT